MPLWKWMKQNCLGSLLMRRLARSFWDVENKLTYHCRHCSFVWNAWEGNFQKVLVHEKTHTNTSKKKKQAQDIVLTEGAD